MKLLLCLLFVAALLQAPHASAAQGDPLQAEIRSDGWSAAVVLDDMAEGGTYNFGWSAQNRWSTSTKTVVFTVTSEKPLPDGTVTTFTRQVYGTTVLNEPGTSNPGDYVSGGDLVVVFGLSDWVYEQDEAGAGKSGTNITVTIADNWYINGGTNSAPVTGFPVTNNSTRAYFKTDFAWSCVPFLIVEGNELRVSALASSHHPYDGKPCQAVKFLATDGNATQTITSSGMVIDGLEGDHKVCAEYIARFDNTAFAQGATIVVNAVAYPHIGDASNLYETSGFTTAPSWKSGPITFICDKTGAYKKTKVLVGPGGDNTSGAAYDSAAYNPDTAAKCATAAGALVKALAYNVANYGRNDLSGVVIEFEAGTYAGLGGTGSFGNVPPAWVTLQPRSGVAASDVVWSTTTGATNISEKVRVRKINLTTTSTQFSGVDALWLDQCILNSSGTSVISGSGFTWVTGCDIPQWAQGLRPFSTANNAGFVLVRGNDFTGFRSQVITPVFLANVKNDRSSMTPGAPSILLVDQNGGAAGPMESLFVAYNELFGLANAVSRYWNNIAYAPVRGITWMENLCESVSNSTQYPLFQLSGSDQYNQTFTSAKIWNNTLMGERNFICYNDSATNSSPVYYYGVEMKNNICWEHNIKGDLHGTPSPTRIGNWSVYYGVGWSGNLNSDSGTSEPPFHSRWAGINSFEDNWGTNTAYWDFLDYQATIYTGQPNSLGLGDYRLGPASPARDVVHDLVTNYDLEGNPRGLPDSAGPYTTYVSSTPSSTINATNTTATNINIQ